MNVANLGDYLHPVCTCTVRDDTTKIEYDA